MNYQFLYFIKFLLLKFIISFAYNNFEYNKFLLIINYLLQ